MWETKAPSLDYGRGKVLIFKIGKYIHETWPRGHPCYNKLSTVRGIILIIARIFTRERKIMTLQVCKRFPLNQRHRAPIGARVAPC